MRGGVCVGKVVRGMGLITAVMEIATVIVAQ